MLVQKIVVTIIPEHLLRITFTGARVPIYLFQQLDNPFYGPHVSTSNEKSIENIKL